MVNPTGRTLILQKLQTSVGKTVAIYITQMEKPTIGSAQTQKSTGKVASKDEQGKTVGETGKKPHDGEGGRAAWKSTPHHRDLWVSLFLCPKSYTHTQELTLLQH